MNTISLLAPAKINLCLDVLDCRPDGYHNIETIMQTVTLFDTLEMERMEAQEREQTLFLSCSDPTLSCESSNLCYRAAQAFFQFCGISTYRIAIFIQKKIPIAAGLAGGSSDAATTLLGLNSLFHTELPIEILCEMGTHLGADVPFCIRKGTMIATGIGEKMVECPPMPACSFVIALHGEKVSTPWAYQQLDQLAEKKRKFPLCGIKEELRKKNLVGIATKLYNIFEKVVLEYHEEAREIKRILVEHDALGALMSGSGPAVFGIFATEKEAQQVTQQLQQKGIFAYCCHPYFGEVRKDAKRASMHGAF